MIRGMSRLSGDVGLEGAAGIVHMLQILNLRKCTNHLAGAVATMLCCHVVGITWYFKYETNKINIHK
jgi:hypothetical protein